MRTKKFTLLIFMLSGLLCICGCHFSATQPLPSSQPAFTQTPVVSPRTTPYETPTPTPSPNNTENPQKSIQASPSPTPFEQTEDGEPPAPSPTITPNTCSISVRCDTIFKNSDKINKEKLSHLPADGNILPAQTVTFADGDSVFDVLLRTLTAHKIHLEFSETPLYQSVYVEGISNLYEFDCGEGSGWLFRINEEFPSCGVSEIEVTSGDKIEFLYTCDFGKDIKQNSSKPKEEQTDLSATDLNLQ